MHVLLKTRESEFTTTNPLDVFVCTWNAGASIPSKEGLRYTGIFNRNNNCQLVIVALQEMVELKPKNLMMSTAAKHHTQKVWQEVIHDSIGGSSSYFFVAANNLVGV